MPILTLAAALFLSAPTAKDPAFGQLAWMAGAWVSDQGDSRGEEHWILSGSEGSARAPLGL
jgi:predicted dehydrogenase